jgi:hypothetical protein
MAALTIHGAVVGIDADYPMPLAEDVVSQEKVSAYFSNITKTPATLDPLQIDMFGNIRNWPENLFGDEMGDITEQANAAMKKRIEQCANGSEASE